MYNVNLVFHGVFAFVLGKKRIDVLFPYFSSHDYLFGCWKDFEPLPKGHVGARGLEGINHCQPDPDFDATQLPTVAAGLTKICPNNLFCGLRLHEYPSAVYCFRPYSVPPSSDHLKKFPYMGVHGDSIDISTLAGPVVLRYQTEDPGAVQFVFRDKPLKFNRHLESGFESLNIHFFAEGERDLPKSGDPDRTVQAAVHYNGVWTGLTSMIASLDVRLDKLYPFVSGHNPIPTASTLPDLPPEQLLDLDELLPVTGIIIGGDTDCEFAHLVIDNRA